MKVKKIISLILCFAIIVSSGYIAEASSSNDEIEITIKPEKDLVSIINKYKTTYKNYNIEVPDIIVKGQEFSIQLNNVSDFDYYEVFLEGITYNETTGDYGVKEIELDDVNGESFFDTEHDPLGWVWHRGNAPVYKYKFKSDEFSFPVIEYPLGFETTLECKNNIEGMKDETLNTNKHTREAQFTITNLIIKKYDGHTLIGEESKQIVLINDVIEYYQVMFYFPMLTNNGPYRAEGYLTQYYNYGMDYSLDLERVKDFMEFGDFTIGKTRVIRYSLNDSKISGKKKDIYTDIISNLFTIREINGVATLPAYDSVVTEANKLDKDKQQEFLNKVGKKIIDLKADEFEGVKVAKELIGKVEEVISILELANSMVSYYSTYLKMDMGLELTFNSMAHGTYDEKGGLFDKGMFVGNYDNTFDQVKYFNLGQFNDLINDKKERYHSRFFTHEEVLEKYGDNLINEEAFYQIWATEWTCRTIDKQNPYYNNIIEPKKIGLVKDGIKLTIEIHKFILDRSPII